MASFTKTGALIQIVTRNYVGDPGDSFPSSVYDFQEIINRSTTARRQKPPILWQNPTGLSRQTVVETNKPGVQIGANGYYRSGPTTLWGVSAGFDTEISNFSILPEEITGRLYSSIKNQNVNLAQAIAEYPQACRMFASLAKDMFDTYRSLKRGRPPEWLVRALRRELRDRRGRLIRRHPGFESYWLQYQYGLKPLMSDIFGLVKSLRDKIQEGVLMSASASSSARREASTIYFVGSERVERFGAVDARLKGKAYYTIRDAEIKQLSAFGISNPANLAWELIPFSFVIDWVIPVGVFLQSLDSLNGTSNLVVYYTHRSVRSGFSSIYGATHQILQTDYSRFTGGSSLPMPTLGYKPSSSLTAVLNGGALLQQLRNRG